MITCGAASNYAFMLHLPDECTYKSKNEHLRRGKLNSRLYLCDEKK